MLRWIQFVRRSASQTGSRRTDSGKSRKKQKGSRGALLLLAAGCAGVALSSGLLWAANTTIAGVLVGEASVTATGSASYSLPLQVAPGVKDMTPELSLAYNSRSKEPGILGLGWVLNGLSTIYRCSKSYQLDETVAPLENNDADRLCVDGARLIASTGASDSQYWSASARYHTYEESWVRYTPVSGSFSHGPGSFTAKTRDGKTLTYGEAATGGGYGAGRWHLTQIKDRNNNQINISYSNTGGMERPNEITYNGHKIKFVYAAANVYNKEIFYTTNGPNGSGDQKYADRRLDRIEMYANGGLFKTYKFTYKSSASSKRYLITKIEECSAVDGGECLEPVNISWNEFNFHGGTGGNFRRFQPGSETSGDSYQFDLIGLTNLPYGQFAGARLYPGDFDGDGRTDFIALRQHNGSTGGTESFCVYYATGSTKSNGTFSRACPSGTYKDNTNTNRSYQDTIRGRTDNGEGVNLALGDFNGDGRMDFLRQEYGGWAGDSTNTFNVFLSNGLRNGTFTVTNPTNASMQSKLKGTHGGSSNGVYLIVGDYNGDGNEDFIAQQHGGWGSGGTDGANVVVYLSNGSGGFSTATPSGQGEVLGGGVPGNTSSDGVRLIPGDYNGDGRTDFIRQEFGGWAGDHISSFRVYFSNGNGQFSIVDPPANSDYQKYLKGTHGSSNQGVNIFPGDFNGDGRDDFISQRYGDWADNTSDGKWKTFQVWLSKGNGYFEEQTPFNSQSDQLPFIGTSSAEGYLTCYGSCQFQTPVTLTTDGAFLRIVDLNGDGKADVMRQDDDTGFKLYYARGDGLFDNPITPSGSIYQNDLKPGKVFLTLGDYDGDGKTDFLKQEYGSAVFTFPSFTYDNNFAVYLNPANYHQHSQPSDTVRRITQGRIDYNITYGLMTEMNPGGGILRTHGGGSNFIQPLNTALWLTTKIRQDPHGSSPGIRDDDYTYRAPVSGNEGGLLGFREVEITNQQKQLRTRTLYEFHALDDFRAARVEWLVVYNTKGTSTQSDDTILRRQPHLHTWTLTKGYLTGSGNSTYVMRSDSRQDHDEAHTNGVNRYMKTEITYDARMNPLLVKTSYPDYVGMETYYTCTNYYYNLGVWYLNDVKDRTAASSCTVSGSSCSCSGTFYKKTAYEYDSNGNVRLEARYYGSGSGDNLKTFYVNNSKGLPTTITAPNGLATTYTYDANGHPDAVTQGGFVTNYDYDAKWGQEIQRTDPNGSVFRQSYDNFGRLKTADAPHNNGSIVRRQTISYRWSGNNLVRKTDININWNGNRVRTEEEYTNAYGNLVSKEVSSSDSGLGRILKLYEYNHRDQRTKESLPVFSGGTRRDIVYTYGDAYQRLTKIDRPVGADSVFSYQTSSNQVVVETRTSSEGTRVKRMDNDYHRRVTYHSFTADEGTRWQSSSYDAVGRKTQVNDNVTSTTITYDMLDRVSERNNDQRGKEIYTYSNGTGWGGMLREINLYDTNNKRIGREKTHFIDALKRPTLIGRDVYDPNTGASLSQRRVSLTYDDAGDCSGWANAKGRLCRTYVERQINGGAFTKLLTRIYGYDNRGNVKTVKTKIEQENNTYIVGYEYGRTENLKQVTYPSGRVVSYDYDHMGRPWRATGGGTTYYQYTNYSAADRPGNVAFGNGAAEVRGYDTYHRLDDMRVTGGGQTHLDQDIIYNDFNEIKTINDATSANKDFSFTYNKWGHLKQAVGTNSYGTLNYSYDSSGRLSQKDGKTYTYNSGTHQVASRTGDSLALTYNAAGSVKQRSKFGEATKTYEYDHNQQMLKVKTGGGTLAEYEYDADGKRWFKKDSNGDRHYYITPELDVQHKGNNSWVHTEYVVGPEGPVTAITENGNGLSLLRDHARHTMLAGLYDVQTVTGATAWFYHTMAMVATHPAAPAAANLLLIALTAFALLAFFWSYFRSGHRNSQFGRLRIAFAMQLAQFGMLSPARAHAFARAHGTGFMRRRRFISLAVPLALVGMLSFQCSSNNNELDGALLPGDGSELLGLLGFASTAGDPIANTTRYFHSNQVGNVRIVTKGDGTASAKPIYKPFGAVHTTGGTNDFRYKFQGKEYDNESGLFYFGARYYDPDLGRFFQADSMIIGGSMPHASNLDRYAAFGNNPINFADPSGNFWIVLAIWAISTIVSFSISAISATIYAKRHGGKVNWKRLLIEEAIGAAISLATIGIGAGIGSMVSRSIMRNYARLALTQAGKFQVRTAFFLGGLTNDYLGSAAAGAASRAATSDEKWTAGEVFKGAAIGTAFNLGTSTVMGSAQSQFTKRTGVGFDTKTTTVSERTRGKLLSLERTWAKRKSAPFDIRKQTPFEPEFFPEVTASVLWTLKSEPNAMKTFNGTGLGKNLLNVDLNKVFAINRKNSRYDWGGFVRGLAWDSAVDLAKGPFNENILYGNHFVPNE